MKTLKTLLLGGVIALLSITSFSNAESKSFQGLCANGYCGYSPTTITIPQGQFEGFSNLSYTPTEERPDAMIIISESNTDDPDNACYFGIYNEGQLSSQVSYNCIAGNTYHVYIQQEISEFMGVLETITLNFEDTNSGNEGTGGSGGSDSGSDSSSLLPNGVSSLTPIINGLETSLDEFIPYVVYVGLGVLGALVGFFAIKRLLRYVRRSSLSVFSSRKRRK